MLIYLVILIIIFTLIFFFLMGFFCRSFSKIFSLMMNKFYSLLMMFSYEICQDINLIVKSILNQHFNFTGYCKRMEKVFKCQHLIWNWFCLKIKTQDIYISKKNHSLLVSYMENFSQSVILCECILTSHTRIYKKKKK